MKRRLLLVLSIAITVPAFAGAEAGSSETSIADGRGHITFETGAVRIGVAPINPDGFVFVDGDAADFGATEDELDGTSFGGRLRFDLPQPDERTWLGRGLRLTLGYERIKGDAASLLDAAGPTVDTNLSLVSASIDGRAIAAVSNDIAGVTAFASVAGPGVGLTGSCTDANGSASAHAGFASDFTGFTNCNTTATSAEANAFVTTGSVAASATANGFVLTGPIPTELFVQKERSVDIRRAEATMEGDYDVGGGLTLSPSLSLMGGHMSSTFLNSQTISAPLNVWAMRHLSGRLESDDVGMGAGAALRRSFASGFDLFASVNASALRRRTQMKALSQTELSFLVDIDPDTSSFQTADTIAMLLDGGNFAQVERRDTIAAFQGTLEVGAGYRFDTGVIGPLRVGLTGALAYDSDMPTYGNIGLTGALDQTPAVAPAHIAYSEETTLTLRAEVTFEVF